MLNTSFQVKDKWKWRMELKFNIGPLDRFQSKGKRLSLCCRFCLPKWGNFLRHFHLPLWTLFEFSSNRIKGFINHRFSSKHLTWRRLNSIINVNTVRPLSIKIFEIHIDRASACLRQSYKLSVRYCARCGSENTFKNHFCKFLQLNELEHYEERNID